jgi:NADH-quinone oxidoreductase subunit A
MHLIEQVAFLEIVTFIAGGLLFIGISSFMGSLLHSSSSNKEQLPTYESGEEAVGNGWGKLNTHYYGIGLVFLLFEVETVLLFPWATVWANPELNEATGGLWASYTAGSGMLFIGLLALGLAYVWRLGHLDGIQPMATATNFASPVPKACYHQVNSRYAPAHQRTYSAAQPLNHQDLCYQEKQEKEK